MYSLIRFCLSVQYLDSLFEKDSKAGVEYHERQVELYAKHDSGKLLRFLRTCPAVPLEKVSLIKFLIFGYNFVHLSGIACL